MFGLSRNTWFLVGGVLLVVVLYLGFSGDDGDANDDPTAQAKKGKGKRKGRGKGKRDKSSAGESGGVGVGKMCAKIDCSEAQLTSFKGMVKEHRKNTSSHRRGLAEAHAKIAAELAEDTIDTAALDDAFEDAAAHRAEIDNSARGVLEAMHAKLSSAQREGVAKMVARHGPTLLLSRPSAGSNKPKKPRAKKGGRKKGLTLRSRSAPGKAQREPDDAPVDSDEAPAAEFSPTPKAAVAPAKADPAQLDDPAELDDPDASATE